MTKRRILILYLAALCLSITLACVQSPWNIQSRPTAAPAQSYITQVTSEAFSGGNVHVRVQYVRGEEEIATLTCDYPDGRGGTSQYRQVFTDSDSLDPGNQDAFDFQIKKNGDYQVICRMGSNEKSSSFKINEPTDGTSSSNPKPSENNEATLVLVLEKATASVTGLFPHHCLPKISISTDGSLTGTCSTKMYGDSEQNTGTLTGQWNGETGDITFRLETISVYTGSRTQNGVAETAQTITTSIIDGTGRVLSDLQATGEANWSTECASSNVEVLTCFAPQQANAKANGTIPWEMNFTR